MPIRQKNGGWEADVTVGNQRVRRSYPTEADAIRGEAELRIALKTGAPMPGANVERALTLGELRARCEALVWSKQKAARKSLSVARLVVDALGADTPVEKITDRIINDYRLNLTRAGNAAGTINRKLAALSKMLALAKREGWIRSKPVIEREKEGKGRDRFLTHDEEARLLATLKVWGCHDEHDQIMFLLDTGARLGEVCALRWDAIAGKRVTFHDTKNGDPRSVPLTARVRAMLDARHSIGCDQHDGCEQGPCKVGPVFPGMNGGRTLQRVWGKVRRHLGLENDPHFVIHILRHTCASRLLQGGMHLEYVARWLGHRSLKVTQRYAHLAVNSLDGGVEILERREESKPRHLGVVQGGQA